MELCERYLHYMSALCEGTMPAPPELALTADTTEERAAQLQSALKDLSVPDFVRLCAKSAGDELDEAIFSHFSEEDFSRALLQMLTAAVEPEEVEEKPPAAESIPDPDAGKHAFEVFCDCVELDEQLVAYLIDILKCGAKAAFYKLSQVTTHLDLDPDGLLFHLCNLPCGFLIHGESSVFIWCVFPFGVHIFALKEDNSKAISDNILPVSYTHLTLPTIA